MAHSSWPMGTTVYSPVLADCVLQATSHGPTCDGRASGAPWAGRNPGLFRSDKARAVPFAQKGKRRAARPKYARRRVAGWGRERGREPRNSQVPVLDDVSGRAETPGPALGVGFRQDHLKRYPPGLTLEQGASRVRIPRVRTVRTRRSTYTSPGFAEKKKE